MMILATTLLIVAIFRTIPQSWKYWLIRYHSQDLAAQDRAEAKKRGRKCRRFNISWRCWWVIWKAAFRLEVSSRGSPGAYFSIDGEDREVTFHVSIYVLSVWFSVRGDMFPRHWFPKQANQFSKEGFYYSGERELGISFHDGNIWINPWIDPTEWSEGNKNIVIHVWDNLAGKVRYATRDLSTSHATISFPEGTYELEIRMFESTWSRPRWFTYRNVRADIKVLSDNGIPIPGKGENSWDCGDSCTSSLTTPAETVGEAIGSLYDSVVQTRSRHGSGVRMYQERKNLDVGEAVRS